MLTFKQISENNNRLWTAIADNVYDNINKMNFEDYKSMVYNSIFDYTVDNICFLCYYARYVSKDYYFKCEYCPANIFKIKGQQNCLFGLYECVVYSWDSDRIIDFRIYAIKIANLPLVDHSKKE